VLEAAKIHLEIEKKTETRTKIVEETKNKSIE